MATSNAKFPVYISFI